MGSEMCIRDRPRRILGCGALQLRARIHHRLPLARCGLALFGHRDAMSRGAILDRLLHRLCPFGALVPASAPAFHPIDPVLAVGGRLAGPRQALHFRGTGRGGWRGISIEECGKCVRRRRRRRQTGKTYKSGKTNSQMTGHGNPRCCAPARPRALAVIWVAMRLKSGNAVDSLWPQAR